MEQPEMEMEQPDAVSEVLGLDHLLDQILLRLDIPVFLVLASQVNKSWRRRATDKDFLVRFRSRLALRPRPRPLGFYVSFVDALGLQNSAQDRTKFVPMSQQHPELADVMSSAFFGNFGDNLDPGEKPVVLDCRNGRVILNQSRRDAGPYVVLGPLDPAPAPALLPPLPPHPLRNKMFWSLADYRRDGTLCVYVGIPTQLHQPKDMVRLARLQGDNWVSNVSYVPGLSATLGYPFDQLLVGDNLYMLSSKRYIVRLDLVSMRFRVIQLPDGWTDLEADKQILSRAYDDLEADKQILSRAYNDFGINFIEIKGLHLHVWVCKSDGDNAGTWMLEADISLPAAFGDLANLIADEDGDVVDEPDDGRYELLRLLSPGDNADFVFLVDGGTHFQHIFYLDIRTRNVEEVYGRLVEDGEVFRIRHFMMT